MLEISPRPVYIKIGMWGVSQDYKVEQGKPLVFNVRTNSTLLREYLRDMKVAVIKLQDSRNHEEIGTGLISWILYMIKSEVKSSPFL